MNSQTAYIKVLRTSPWVQYHKDDLPARIVLWKPDDTQARQTLRSEQQYATHLEVQQEDGTLSFNWGHYDMFYNEAVTDFVLRESRLTEARPNLCLPPEKYSSYIEMQSEQRGAI